MQQLASVASSQLEKLIRRISALVLIAVGVETLTNAAQQTSIEDSFALLQLVIFVVFSLLAVFGLWFDLGPVWVSLYGIAVLVLIWLAPIEFTSPEPLGPEGRPWIWWAIGLSAILVAVFTNRIFASIYIPSVSISWFIVEVVIFGEARFLQATLDSAYFIVFALAILGLVGVVRQAAQGVDAANTEAIQSSLERARVEAIERERQRIDALVHDQVLHTLLVAARARTSDEKRSAKNSAKHAIDSLQAALAEQPTAEKVTVSGLLSAISSAAQNLDSRVTVDIEANSHLTIPTDAAQALTEAAIQALDNAIQHSSANKIKLKMFSDKSSQISILIEDDGVGFRMNRVPRDRLGIRTSIEFRVQSVGGSAAISSSPGKGTVVSLRWGN